MSRTTIPVADTPCERCPNLLLASEARVSHRALNAVLCWRCRAHLGNFPSVHQAPQGCYLSMAGTGYGLWRATLRLPGGQEFTGQAFTDHEALSVACAQAREAGALA